MTAASLSLPRIAGRVVVIGDVMEDVVVVPDGPLMRGSDQRARIEVLPGGSGANQAVWLARMGLDVALAAHVGAKDVGRLTAGFRRTGVVPWFGADRRAPTGRLVCIVETDGERSFYTDRGANLHFTVDDLPEGWLGGVGLLALSGYAFFEPHPRAAVLQIMAAARAASVAVAIDPSSTAFLSEVGPDTFIGWTRGADLFFPNAAEAALLSGSEAPEEQVRRLGAHYGLVVIKRGAEGAIAGDRSGIRAEARALPARVLDTTGAGDAFLAGFVARLMGGGDLAACLAAGNAAGARAIGAHGAQTDIPA